MERYILKAQLQLRLCSFHVYPTMKGSPGTFLHHTALQSLSSKVVGILCCHSSESRHERLDSKLERRMMEIKRNTEGQNNFRSINSIIMKFPQFKEGLQEIRDVFEHYGEDKNASIDREELKKCLQTLQLTVTEEEIDDLFYACDINEHEGIQLNEFIVLLCLIYFLKYSPTSSDTISNLISPQLEATFSTAIEAFLFLDKNGDGRLNKKDVVKALNEPSSWEKSPSHVTRTRFSVVKLAIILFISLSTYEKSHF